MLMPPRYGMPARERGRHVVADPDDLGEGDLISEK
jgi:hypothetical protein